MDTQQRESVFIQCFPLNCFVSISFRLFLCLFSHFLPPASPRAYWTKHRETSYSMRSERGRARVVLRPSLELKSSLITDRVNDFMNEWMNQFIFSVSIIQSVVWLRLEDKPEKVVQMRLNFIMVPIKNCLRFVNQQVLRRNIRCDHSLYHC